MLNQSIDKCMHACVWMNEWMKWNETERHATNTMKWYEWVNRMTYGLINEWMEECINERTHAFTHIIKVWITESTKHYETYAMDNNGNKTRHGLSDWSKIQKKHKHNEQWEGKSSTHKPNIINPKANQLKHVRHELNTCFLINNIKHKGNPDY